MESQHVANPRIYECHITGILNHESRMITRSNSKMSITLNVDFFRIGLIKINLISSILPVFKNRKSYISLHPTHGVHYRASDIFCYFHTLVFPSVYTSRKNRFDCTVCLKSLETGCLEALPHLEKTRIATEHQEKEKCAGLCS